MSEPERDPKPLRPDGPIVDPSVCLGCGDPSEVGMCGAHFRTTMELVVLVGLAEAALTAERARSDALAVEVADLRAFIDQEVMPRYTELFEGVFGGERDLAGSVLIDMAKAVLARESGTRGAEILAAGDAMASAIETLGLGYLLLVGTAYPHAEDDLVDIAQKALNHWRALRGGQGGE